MRSPAGFPSRARREDLLPLAGRQAGTVVLDRERDSPTSTLDGDRDGRPPVATRVLDDRMQHPLGQIGVDAEPQALARRLCDNVDVTFLGERLDTVDRRRDDGVCVGRAVPCLGLVTPAARSRG